MLRLFSASSCWKTTMTNLSNKMKLTLVGWRLVFPLKLSVLARFARLTFEMSSFNAPANVCCVWCCVTLTDAPFCRPGQHRVYGVARHEEARISCDLDANPSGSLHFRWLFNSSAGVIELPASTWTAEGSRSIARYLPSSDLDFGTLLCSAHNSIGQQAVPCLYHVIPAGKLPSFHCSSFLMIWHTFFSCSLIPSTIRYRKTKES